MRTNRRRFRVAFLVLVGLSASLTAATSVHAQLKKGKALRPEQKSCLDCHSKVAAAYNSRASKHQPVRDGKCETCHRRHGVVGVLRLAAEDPDLCLTCHAMEGAPPPKSSLPKDALPREPLKVHKFAHPPGESLKCGKCHDPHGSDHPSLVKEEGSAACLGCHKVEEFQGVSVHQPGTISCLTCHDPHGTGSPGSLAREPGQICVTCHQGKTEEERKGHGPLPLTGSSCLSCHAPHASQSKGLMRRKVHAPMAEGGNCETCHVTEGEGAKTFALTAPTPDLCLNCHDDPRKPAGAAAPAKRVHAPVAAGECLTCHSPHASDWDGLLKTAESDLCGTCHAESKEAKEAKVPHVPAKEKCTSCHQPHAGPERMLSAAIPGLCENCHASVGKEISRKSAHPPAAAGDCMTCHAPHGSAYRGILKDSAEVLCMTCHEDLRKDLDARNSHPPFRSGDCAKCHEPHGADTDHLIVADLGRACLNCHKEEASALPDGGRHAPFASGECLSCHRPHASNTDGLLSAEPNAICRACHDELAGEKEAASRHLPVQRGQCLSCHGPHGGVGEAFLRREDTRALCLSCHTDQSKQIARKDLTIHVPFSKDSCLACHSAHASKEDALLAKGPAALCASCHDVTKPGLKTAHKGLIRPTTDCTTCHEPHASETKNLMLAAQHPPYADGDCSVCHQGGVTP